MLLRQDPDSSYAYPDHRGWFRKLLWKLGFDSLTVYERLKQTDKEREYWYEEARRYAGNTDFWRAKVDGNDD